MIFKDSFPREKVHAVLSVSGRQKWTTWVLSIFTAIRHLLHHSSMISSIFCRASSLGAITTMSSAYSSIGNFVPLISTPQFRFFIPEAKSFRYIENKSGLMISPCLTPELTSNESVNVPFTLTWAVEELYIVDSELNRRPCIPKDVTSLYNSRSRDTQPKPFLKSTNAQCVFSPVDFLLRMIDDKTYIWSWQLWSTRSVHLQGTHVFHSDYTYVRVKFANILVIFFQLYATEPPWIKLNIASGDGFVSSDYLSLVGRSGDGETRYFIGFMKLPEFCLIASHLRNLETCILMFRAFVNLRQIFLY